jgi:hypothetical protein
MGFKKIFGGTVVQSEMVLSTEKRFFPKYTPGFILSEHNI